MRRLRDFEHAYYVETGASPNLTRLERLFFTENRNTYTSTFGVRNTVTVQRRLWLAGLRAVAFVALVTALLFGLVRGVMWLSQQNCRQTAAQIGVDWKWGGHSGCFVEVRPGVWFPPDQIRDTDLLDRSDR